MYFSLGDPFAPFGYAMVHGLRIPGLRTSVSDSLLAKTTYQIPAYIDIIFER